jgi:hypothetical protein
MAHGESVQPLQCKTGIISVGKNKLRKAVRHQLLIILQWWMCMQHVICPAGVPLLIFESRG